MKKILTFLLVTVCCHLLKAQSVGIGTPTPNAKAQLDVVSTNKGLLIPRMTAAERLAIQAPIPAGLMVYETTTNSFWFYNASAWSQLGAGGSSPWTVSGNNIYNSNTGNVGVGNAAPSSKLHVAGSLRLETTGPDVQFAEAGVSKGFIQTDGNDLRLGTNSGNSSGKMIIRMDGTNRIYVDSIGQMGIGTSTPDHKLDVNGKIRITPDNFSSNASLLLYPNPENGFDPLGPSNISFFNWADNGSGGYNYSQKYLIKFEGSTSERLRIHHTDHDNQLVLRNNGRVGINYLNPQEQLHVGGSLMLQDDAPILKFRLPTTMPINSEPGIEFGTSSNILAKIKYIDGGLRLTANNSNIPDLVLKNGNVGIGTTVTPEKLNVLGNMTMNGGVDPTIQFKVGADKGFVQIHDDDLRIGTNSSNINGKFVVRTAAGDKFFIDNAGYAGINVTGVGALSQLHIGSGADANLTNNGYFMMGYPNGSNLIMDNNEIMARNNGAAGNLVLQNDGGTVRIGNAAVPNGYKFAINGKMICEELRVKLASTWPDYVFNNDYKLLPLTALEKFIEQNKHLPNIPKASVIEKEGIAVGDMQKKMMEKIEELTLYIIDLQKQIDEVKKKKGEN